MPVEQANTVQITCDNPDCPGTDLDPADRTGWFFVTSEIYGQPTKQHVFCCKECAAAGAINPDVSLGEPVVVPEPVPGPGPGPISPGPRA